MALWLGGASKVLNVSSPEAHHDDKQDEQKMERREHHVQGRALLGAEIEKDPIFKQKRRRVGVARAVEKPVADEKGYDEDDADG